VLNKAPLSTKNQSIKDRAVQTVLKVLLTFKSVDIEGAVRTLDQQRLDLLMRYIYRGFEFPSEGSSAQLLLWHEKVFAVGGLGCIVRVLTDRKRV
jgi:actin related protein 2/3 complex subunit 5